jgi:hypothetical protein
MPEAATVCIFWGDVYFWNAHQDDKAQCGIAAPYAALPIPVKKPRNPQRSSGKSHQEHLELCGTGTFACAGFCAARGAAALYMSALGFFYG